MFFFFFQAEDGIRDTSVTGVQTCALPIFPIGLQYLVKTQTENGNWTGGQSGPGITGLGLMAFLASGEDPNFGRSEERRVGKECRYRGGTEQDKKNIDKEVRSRVILAMCRR